MKGFFSHVEQYWLILKSLTAEGLVFLLVECSATEFLLPLSMVLKYSPVCLGSRENVCSYHKRGSKMK